MRKLPALPAGAGGTGGAGGAGVPEAEDPLGGEILDLIDGVESKLAQLKQAKAGQEKLTKIIADQQEELGRIERELNDRAGEVAAREQSLQEREDELAQLSEVAREDRRVAEEAAEEAKAALVEVEAQRAEIGDAEAEIAAARERAEKASAEARAALAQAEQRREELGGAQAQIAAAQEQAERADAALRDAYTETEKRENELDEARGQLAQARDRAELAAEQAREALAQTDRHKQEIDRLGAEADELRARAESAERSDAARGKELESVRAEAESARAQASDSDTAHNKELARLRAEVDSAARERDDFARAVEQREAALLEQREQMGLLETEAEGLRAKAGEAEEAERRVQDLLQQRDALLGQQDMTIAARTEELETQRQAAEAAHAKAVAEADRVAETLRSELAEAKAELQASERAHGSRSEAIDDLSNDLRTAREALEAAKAEAKAGRAAIAERDAALDKVRALEEALELAKAAADGVAALDEALDDRAALRRARLKRYKELLQEQAQKLVLAKKKLHQAAEDQRATGEQLAQERSACASTRRELDAAVARAAAKTVKSRVASAVCMAAVAVLLIGGASVWAAKSFVAGGRAASATLRAGADTGGAEANAEALEAWRAYCENLVADPRLAEAAADRMRLRGIEELSNAAALGAYVRASLDVDFPAPDTMRMHLRGEHAGTVQRALDTLAAAVVSSANDGFAVAAGKPKTVIAEAAQAEDEPMNNDWVMAAGMMWGGGSALALLAGLGVWVRLSRSKERYDADEAVFEAAAAEAQSWRG